MTSSSVVRLFVGSLVVCCLVASVFGAAETITFTAATTFTSSISGAGTCPITMSAANTITFTSNVASINCAISGSPISVTFGTGGSTATYANSNTYSQSAGTLSVSSGQSVSFSSITYNAGAVTIDGTLSANTVTATTGALTVSSTGTLQTTAGNLGLTAGASGNALTLGGSIIATGGNLGIVNFAVTAAPMTSLIRASGNVVINPWATTTLGGPISCTGGNIQVNPNTGAGLALTISGTVVNSNSGGSIALGAGSDITSLTVSGPVGLNNGPFTANTAAGTATFSSPISGASNVNLPATGSVTITASGSFGFTGNFLASGSGVFSHAGLIAGNSSSTIDINPSGATTTITGVVQCLNPTIGSNVFRIRPTGATVSFSSATIITPGEVSIGNAGAATYAFTSSTLNFGTQFTLANPTTFTNPTFVTTNWNVQISGGSSVAGPSGTALPFTYLASSNAITSSLFPSGINTNCIWVQAPASTTSFAVTLPNAIQYRNYVQASPNALTVTSTNGGAVTRCAPLLTSVLDRRNDVFKNNLVYFGGNAVFYFVTNQALPFGTITASDFTVSGGSITSVTSLGGSPTAFAIVVSLTCDGVVSLSYNGSLTGNGGNFLGISSGSADRVVNAKCIANIYAPCG